MITSEINGHEHEPQWSPFVGTPALRGRAKSQSANSAFVWPDHYHPVDHTHCWWVPTRRTNARSASLVQVQCKVCPKFCPARTRRRGHTPGCLSLLWTVQILSLYKKTQSRHYKKDDGAGRVAATRPRTFITPHTPGTPPQKEISPRRHPRCCTHEPESPGLYACLRPRLRNQGRMRSWSK